MDTTNNTNTQAFLNQDDLDKAFRLLNYRLCENISAPIEIVVCGGASLILTGFVSRTTTDVDIVALAVENGFVSPDPLPDHLILASREVAEDLGLHESWLNNGPSRGVGGLFQMGLPDGLISRVRSKTYGSHLVVHFTGRLDQIFFKLYASVDRGGYHIEDLVALCPTNNEIRAAAKWATTHDVSSGFKLLLNRLLRDLGYERID
jgi:hypothetical protein